MGRRAAFTQAEVTRALSAAQKLNLPVSSYEIAPDGRIVVHTAVGRLDADDADVTLAEWKKKNGKN